MVEKCLEEDVGVFRGQIQTVVDTLEVWHSFPPLNVSYLKIM